VSAGRLADAAQPFLAGNGLPGRWAGRHRFVILDTAFGAGHTFLAAWAAWQQDPRRCHRLWYLAIAPRPPARDALALAHAGSPWPALADELMLGWPVLAPGLHLVHLNGGRVRLLLALGDVAAVLPELLASVDAFILGADDGSASPAPATPGNPATPAASAAQNLCPATAWDRHLLRQLTRLAAPGATLVAGSASAPLHPALHPALRTAGFKLGPVVDGQATTGHFAPRFPTLAPPGRRASAGVRRVAVVGAGLAGAAVAQALAARGLVVQVFERQPAAAAETSGNAGGLFHGIAHPADGPHARWLRAAALHTERVLRPLIEAGTVPGAIGGLLRGERTLSAGAMQALIDQLALPADYLRVQREGLPAGLAGLAVGAGPNTPNTPAAAWAYPGGGWVAPAALCAHWLAGPGITLRCGVAVQHLQPAGQGWRLLDADGQPLGDADAVVLCNAADVQRLLAPSPTAAAWPLRRVRGQTTLLPAALGRAAGLPALPQPLADTGYALQLPDGRWLCGATAQPDDPDPTLRRADHQHNLATLRRLTGWAGNIDPGALDGRVGWRLQTDDRLPLLGPVAAEAGAGAGAGAGAEPDPPALGARHRRPDQPRLVPRIPGLYVFTALGSRGITQAALGAEVLASWLTGEPVPLPASLLDSLDVARYVSRAVRRPPPPA